MTNTITHSVVTPVYPIEETKPPESLEETWKTVFLNVFKKMLWEKQHDLLYYGSPYLGGDEVLTRFALSDGLSLMRSGSENDRLRYLLKAWRVKNQKRGFHFLRTYLQMLYPNAFHIEQRWQETSKAYPTALSNERAAKEKGTPHWLTSRIRIEISDISENGQDILQYISTIKSIVSARFVVDIAVLREFGAKTPSTLSLSSAFTAFQTVSFSGECVLPEHHLTENLSINAGLISSHLVSFAGMANLPQT